MLTLVDKQGKEAVTTCNGCGMYRLCKQTSNGLWLCVNGPCKCYRHRKGIKARKERKESE